MIDYGYVPLQDTLEENEVNSKGLTRWKIQENEKEYTEYQRLEQKLQSHENLWEKMNPERILTVTNHQIKSDKIILTCSNPKDQNNDCGTIFLRWFIIGSCIKSILIIRCYHRYYIII